jgi:hypothetical protein
MIGGIPSRFVSWMFDRDPARRTTDNPTSFTATAAGSVTAEYVADNVVVIWVEATTSGSSFPLPIPVPVRLDYWARMPVGGTLHTAFSTRPPLGTTVRLDAPLNVSVAGLVYSFVRWDLPASSSTATRLTFRADADTSVVARYAPKPNVTLTFRGADTDAMTPFPLTFITPALGVRTAPVTLDLPFASPLTMTAPLAFEGRRFRYWRSLTTGVINTSTTLNGTVDKSETFVAVYER